MRYDFAPKATPPDLWQLAPAIYLLDAVTRVEQLGYDLSQYLRSLGLTRESLEQSGKYVTSDQYYGIIAYCVSELGVPEVGFIQKRNVALLASGVAGLASSTSATVGESIKIVLQYQDLLALPVLLHLDQQGSIAKLTLGKLQHQARSAQQWHRVWAVETLASSVYALFHSLGLREQVITMRFSYAIPEHSAIYHNTFVCPLEFDAQVDEIVFNTEVLDVPQPSADPLVCALATRQCEASVRKLASATSLLDQIEGIILSSSHKAPSVGTVAERLFLSERSLQRRLGELRTSYREIANRIRHRLALDMLNDTDLPIKEIAYLLGYTESPNFSQAFKSIEGISPGNFRVR